MSTIDTAALDQAVRHYFRHANLDHLRFCLQHYLHYLDQWLSPVDCASIKIKYRRILREKADRS